MQNGVRILFPNYTELPRRTNSSNYYIIICPDCCLVQDMIFIQEKYFLILSSVLIKITMKIKPRYKLICSFLGKQDA